MTATQADRGPRAALAAALLIHGLLWLRWMSGAEIPSGSRDEFFLVEVATELVFGRHDLTTEQLRGLTLEAYYPPLARLPGMVALALGGGYHAMVASQLPWAAVLVVAVVGLARRAGGRWTPAIAVALLFAYPAVADATHRFEPNLAATACTTAALAAWFASDDLRDRRAALVLGLFAGLGLLVDRLGAAPFVVVPVLLSVVRRRGELRDVAVGVGLAAGATCAVAGWWYGAFFLPNYLHELLPQWFGGEVGARGDLEEVRPPLLLWIGHYLLLWIDSQLGLVAGVVGWFALAAALLGRLGERARDLAACVAGGLLLFTLVAKRQPFYTVPLLPSVAVLSAAALQAWARPIPGAAGAGVVSAVIIASLLPNAARSGTHPNLPQGALAGWLVGGASPLPESWIGERFPIGAEPLGLGLDVGGLVQDVARHGTPASAPIAVWSSSSAVSESQLLSLLRMERRNRAADGVTVNPEWFEQAVPALGALVTVHPGAQPCGPPDLETVRREFEIRFGWEDRPALVQALHAVPTTGTLVRDQLLELDARLCAWVPAR